MVRSGPIPYHGAVDHNGGTFMFLTTVNQNAGMPLSGGGPGRSRVDLLRNDAFPDVRLVRARPRRDRVDSLVNPGGKCLCLSSTYELTTTGLRTFTAP